MEKHNSILELIISSQKYIDSELINKKQQAKRDLSIAVNLLTKGYTLDDIVEPLINKYKNILSVPDTRTNAGGHINAQKMREFFDLIMPKLPHGHGFCFVAFKFGHNKMASYVSNAEREDMVRELENLTKRLRRGNTFPTPESN